MTLWLGTNEADLLVFDLETLNNMKTIIPQYVPFTVLLRPRSSM